MAKSLLLTTAVLLMPSFAFAQDLANGPSPAQCQQVINAVAQYGYAAARKHALENYGIEAVKFGDQCLTKQPRRISSRSVSNSRSAD